MELQRCATSEAFLAATERYRAGDAIRTNVLGSVATSVATQGAPSECYWWVATDGGEVVGAAMRTPPWVLSLGPMPDAAAAGLAREVARDDPRLPGVAGLLAPVAAFLEAYEAIASSRPRLASSQRQLIYEVERVTLPEVPGAFALATGDDTAVVDEWFGAFASEVEGAPAVRTEEDRRRAATTVSEGRVRLWHLDGATVSMAGHAMPVAMPSGVVTRVGPVYTPPERRRHGYGGAVTAALSAELLARGSRVMLYTDASNPTSNKIYRELGYELVDEFVHHSFAGSGHH